MKQTAVLSDLGGVVVEFDTDRVVHYIAQAAGRSFDDVQQAVYHKERLLPFELGQIQPEAYYEGLRSQLRLSWSYDQFVRFWNDIFTENRPVSRLLQKLRSRMRLFALSNTNVLHLDHIKNRILSPSLFHEWIASCDVGLRKPDPRIYRLALEKAGVSAQETVYIDDRPEMVEAGRAEGLQAIRFENLQQLERDLRQAGIEV